MDTLSYAERILRWLWSRHFHIDPLIHHLILLAATASILAASLFNFGIMHPAWPAWRNAVLLFAAVVSIGSLVRWRVDRWRTRGGLVVASFDASDPQMAEQLRNRIVTHLRDRLPPTATRRVHVIPVTLGAHDRPLVERVHRVLRAHYILHGDIRGPAESFTVHPRLMERVDRPVYHQDWFTKDTTPAFNWRARLINALTPTRPPVDHAYPPEFASELEALLKALTGQVQGPTNPASAVQELTDALAICATSQSPQVDLLVADLAHAFLRLGQPDAALELVRPRADRTDPVPAPELLRRAHHVVVERLEWLPSDHYTREVLTRAGITWLRRAAAQLADHARDISLYNLAIALRDIPSEEAALESAELLREVRRISSYYRRAWYVYRELGATAWSAAQSVAGSDARYYFSRAAANYSKAIRARPRFRLIYRRPDGSVELIASFPRRAIMHANAADAHLEAGHRWRHHRLRRRADKLRMRELRTAQAGWRDGDAFRAYAHFDWAFTGWNDDIDVVARVGRYLAATRAGLPPHLVEDFRRSVDQTDPTLARTIEQQLDASWS